MIAAASQSPAAPITSLRLFGPEDEPWIEELLDLVERSLGEPWRVLLERVDDAALRRSPAQVAAILAALRRVTGGRDERARVARKLRGKVLGHPALDRDARDARIACAAAELGLLPADVESLLWADLARERPVVLPRGRPSARSLVGFANVDRIQRCMRRASSIELRVWSESTALVRTGARCGLIVAVSRPLSHDARAHDDGDGPTLLQVTGPLGLFHATTVYGRALGALVPLLADHARFTLDIHADYPSGPRTLRVEPPVILPPVPLPRSKSPSLVEYLARDLERAGCEVEREPPPIACGTHVLYPDAVVVHRGARMLVEIVGFSTAAYLAEKRACYAAIGQPVVLCVDATRAAPGNDPDDEVAQSTNEGKPPITSDVLRFRRRIDAAALMAMIEG